MKKIITFVYLITMFFISGCEASVEDYGYDDLEEYHININVISYEESKELVESSTGTRELILFSNPESDHCQLYFPTIVNELEEFDFIELYYIDTSQMTIEEESNYTEYYQELVIPATYVTANGYIQDKIIGAAPGTLVREFLIRHYH
ncbi:hypothetical protein RI065_05780 [Mycoplasmatota bacterium zrk1]